MIKFSCPECGHTMKVPSESAGKRGKCKECRSVIQVPRQKRKPADDFDEFGGFDEPPRRRPASSPGKGKQRPSRKVEPVTNVVGIVGLVLGIMALLASWIPIVNLFTSAPLGIIGGILAVVGFFMANSNKGMGIGFPVAAAATNGIALVVTVVVTLFLASAVVDGLPQIKQDLADMEAAGEFDEDEIEMEDVEEEAVAEVSNDPSPTESEQENQEAAPEEAAPSNASTELNVPWEKAYDTYDGEIVKIRIVSAKIEKIEQKIAKETTFTEEPMLSIQVEVTNKKQMGRLQMSGWGSGFGRSAQLQDETGKEYEVGKFEHPLHNVIILGRMEESRMKPNSSAQDRLIFDAPDETAKQLRLSLSAGKFGEEGEVHLVFDPSIIER
ncbi:MAG: hypothetical protein R3C11_18660 [Planctomycetaceae bacterium]